MWLLQPIFCVAGSQDADDNLHTQRDFWPRTHHQTLPVQTNPCFPINQTNSLIWFVLYELCILHHFHSDPPFAASTARPTPAAPSPTSVSASTCTSWWGWTRRGTVSAPWLECRRVCRLLWLRFTVFSRRKAMKGRLYFATKAQKDGKILIKTHPCAQIFCCDICGFEKVSHSRSFGTSTVVFLSLQSPGCTDCILPLDGTPI